MSLREFLKKLEKEHEIINMKDKFSVDGEIQSIEAEKEKSIILRPKENPQFRFTFNLLNTRKKLALALGTTLNGIHKTFISAVKNPKPYSIKKIGLRNKLKNLYELPIIHHYKEDIGPYITSSIITSRNPETKIQNFSIHRLRLLDKRRLVIRMVEGRHLHRIYTLYKEKKRPTPISICIGVHPVVEVAAAYQAPYTTDELTIANSIRKLNVFYSPLNQLAVPDCEILIEGEILPNEKAEDCMVEMLGNYDYIRMQPIVKVKEIFCKEDPIFRDILPASREHRLLMSFPVEAKLNMLLKEAIPSVKKVILTNGGCNWLHAVVQISKKFEGEAKNVILAAFTAHPSLKLVIVVDEDIDPEDPVDVEYAIATRFQASEDLIIIRKAKGSSLDPSSDQEFILTDKVGIDATISLKKNIDRFRRATLFKK